MEPSNSAQPLAGRTCPLVTEQLADIVLQFIIVYNEPAGIHVYAYQRVFMRRIIVSVLNNEGVVITGLWSRQCLAQDTVILDRDGSACRIKDHPRAWQTGIDQPVYRVRAQNGFELVATANHPFLTQRGWIPLCELENGDDLCTLDEWDRFGDGRVEMDTTVYINKFRSDLIHDEFEITPDHGRLLGYLTADGYAFRALEINQSIKFTNITEQYLYEVEDLVNKLFLDIETKWYPKGRGYDILCVSKQGRSSKTNTLRRFLSAMQPDDKFPTAIFGAPKASIIAFFQSLYSSDGCASRGIQLACGGSKVYAHYAQLLLARLGIDCRIKPELMNGTWFYRTSIDDKPNLVRFLEIIGPIPGKEEACAALDTILIRWSRRSYEQTSDGEDGEKRHWSKLISVEPAGTDDVWDINYPDKGWFFAQGIAVHNSGKSESLACLSSGLCIFLPALCKQFPDDPRLPYAEGFKVGIFAPKLDQANYIYDRIRQRANKESSQEIYNDESLQIGVAVSRGDRVSWTNGSFVIAKTASEQSNVEGGTYHLVIIDEAQNISESKIEKEITPQLAATNGTMVKIGTANALRGNFRKNIIYNIELEQKGGPRNHFEFPYDIVIAEKRKIYYQTKHLFHLAYEKFVQGQLVRLGGNIENEEFRQNFRLLWQEANFTAIDPDAFEDAREYDREWVESNYTRRHVAGLDYGRKRDVTILNIAEVDDIPILDPRAVQRPGDEAPVFFVKTTVAVFEIPGRKWHDILQTVVDHLGHFSVDLLVADGTGVGDPLTEQLQSLIPSVKVVPFVMSHVGNDLVYKLYIQEIEAGRMRHVAGPETMRTPVFEEYEHQHMELLKERKGVYMRCFAPDGEHDDHPDAGALCCYAASIPSFDERVEVLDNPFYTSRASRSITSRADRYR